MRPKPTPQRILALSAAAALCPIGLLAVAACTPTVKVEPGEKPIVINLNVKIEQEVRIRVEDDTKKLIQKRPDLF